MLGVRERRAVQHLHLAMVPACTDGHCPVVAGPGEGGLEKAPPMSFALGFGRLSRCLILMAFFSDSHKVCLPFLSAG